jgi:hypothetical protein
VVCKEGGKLLVPYMGYIDVQLKALTHLCVLYIRFWLISQLESKIYHVY